jgi:D-alanyl-D-alanine carboxypeptidase (penicillin-binding protein 5/6)
VPVVKKGEVLATVPVDKGKIERVELVAAQDLVLLLKKGQPRDFSRELDFPKKALAPLRAGEGAGTLAVRGNDGTELGRVELVPARDVPRAGFLDFLRRFTYRWLHFGR